MLLMCNFYRCSATKFSLLKVLFCSPHVTLRELVTLKIPKGVDLLSRCGETADPVKACEHSFTLCDIILQMILTRKSMSGKEGITGRFLLKCVFLTNDLNKEKALGDLEKPTG